MENTIENKAKFFAKYFGQKVLRLRNSPVSFGLYKIAFSDVADSDYLKLKPLSSITDEDAIEIGRIIYERPKANFILERLNDMIHVRNFTNGIEQHVCLNYKYATLNANVFIPNEKEEIEHFKHNIGEIHLNSKLTISYIKIVDFLRSKGYALPYNGLSVEEQTSRGWINAK